ncbi:hypothetical protein BsWGS_03597 [Bradybaena similaris]
MFHKCINFCVCHHMNHHLSSVRTSVGSNHDGSSLNGIKKFLAYLKLVPSVYLIYDVFNNSFSITELSVNGVLRWLIVSFVNNFFHSLQTGHPPCYIWLCNFQHAECKLIHFQKDTIVDLTQPEELLDFPWSWVNAFFDMHVF